MEAGDDGVAHFEIEDDQVQLSGENTVVGRSFVVHTDVDDVGEGSRKLSSTAGNAGARLACGVIGLSGAVLEEATQKKSKLKLVVVGSMGLDVFLKVDRFAKPGETLSADDSVLRAFGGKGANQAVCAAKLLEPGLAQVQMLGQVGEDKGGEEYIDYLNDQGIDTSLIKVVKGQDTGQAYILSNKKDGENSIVIVGAANQAFPKLTETASGLSPHWEQAIAEADVLLL